MSTPGYPDYARLSAQGGFQLFAVSGTVNSGAILFQGYVGSWPYVNVHTNVNVSADACQVTLVYYSDNTFTTQVGFRVATRIGSSFASTQYSNLSPWLKFYVVSVSGNPMPFLALGLYGTTGYADQKQLASLDVPLLSDNPTIPATSTQSYLLQHVEPGDGVMTYSGPAASWFINVWYWDIGTAGYKLYAQFLSSWNGAGGNWRLPIIDAPPRVDVHNGDGVANKVNITWLAG